MVETLLSGILAPIYRLFRSIVLAIATKHFTASASLHQVPQADFSNSREKRLTWRGGLAQSAAKALCRTQNLFVAPLFACRFTLPSAV
jgi:hypothetical protein